MKLKDDIIDRDHNFISRLPNELLLQIFALNASTEFHCCSYIVSKAENNDEYDNLSKHTRYASQVCRHLRQLIIQSPFLWSRVLSIGSMPEDWFEEVLRRSEQAPLTVYAIYAKSYSDHGAYNLSSVLDNPLVIGNLKTFHCYLEDWELEPNQSEDILTAIQQTPFPILERCTLRFILPSVLDGFDYDYDDDEIEIDLDPVTLFDNHAPNLRHLELSNLVPQPSASFFPHLTTLHLCACPINHRQILGIVQHAVMLRELFLWKNLDTWSRKAETSTTQDEDDGNAALIIDLPHLLRLQIHEQFNESFVGILSSLRTPLLQYFSIIALNVFSGELWNLCLDSLATLTSRARAQTQATNALDLTSFSTPAHIRNDMTPALRPSAAIESDSKTLMFLYHTERPVGSQPSMDLAFKLVDKHPDPDFSGNDSALISSSFFQKFACRYMACDAFRLGLMEAKLDDGSLHAICFPFWKLTKLSVGYAPSTEQVLRVLMDRTMDEQEFLSMLTTVNMCNGAQYSSKVCPSDSAELPLLPSLRFLQLPPSSLDDAVFARLTQFLTWRTQKRRPISLISFNSESFGNEETANEQLGDAYLADSSIHQLRKERVALLNSYGINVALELNSPRTRPCPLSDPQNLPPN